ncbi:MAG: type II secretion system protein [Verrucomicrobiae bacterium]|nr:type II secretion system protein [Verrucomicrobiae bacterium]
MLCFKAKEGAGSGQGRRRGGFTLLELMVTVAVVALLASLLGAGAGRVRARAHGAMCLNHLRQWGLATMLYALDHGDWLPPEGFPNPGDAQTNRGWYIQLPRQMGIPRYHDQAWRTDPSAGVGSTVWLCPANRRRSNGRNLFHYCLNQHVDGTSEGDMPTRLGSVPEPSRMVWLFDSKNLPAVGYWGYVHTNLHVGGAQFLFLDGHARRFRAMDYWDSAADRGRTNHPRIRWVP